MNYAKRIKKLQNNLKRKKIDALLVSQPENRHYLTGYRGGDHGIGETSGSTHYTLFRLNLSAHGFSI